MPQVRRYAIQKAGQMAPKVDRVWTDLLVRVIRAEEDAEVLRGALGLVEGNRFGEALELAAPLASALALRLQARGPGSTREPDALADRVRMARALGGLRVLTPELETLLEATDGLETDVAASLIRALGGIAAVQLDAVLVHYRRHARATARDEAVRVAVVDALGRPGVRATDADAVAASAALREILTGEGDGGFGRSASAEVRQHAIRSLGSFPGAETAAVLRDVALGEDAQEASVAGVVLRKAATKDEHAVQALIEIARAATPPERRIEALQALGALGKNPDLPTLPLARAAARELLQTATPPEVRLEAGAACAALLDAEALLPLAAFWTEDVTRVARLGVFLDLAQALAGTGEAHDAAIVEAFESLAATAPWKAVDDSIASLSEQFPRTSLRSLRARLLLDQALASDTPTDEARGQLAVADALLEGALAGAASEEALLQLRIRVQARWGEIAPDAGERKAHFLQAVSLAAGSTTKATAGLVREILVALEGNDLAVLLSEKEKVALAESRALIEALLQQS